MVSTRDERAGRARQKARTREALLTAAVRVIERHEHPSLAAVAAEAGVSRATAYRYFPSARALLLEAPLAQRFASAEDVLSGLEGASVLERVLTVHRYAYQHAAANEAHFRLFLGAIHEQAVRHPAHSGALRAGRRRRMFDLALKPARKRVGLAELRRLRDALVALTGIDALLVMRDVCGLSQNRGREILDAAIRRLVSATLDEDGATRRQRSR